MFEKTFRGGIHPKGHKELSRNVPIVPLQAGKTVTYLMNQHIGAPATPIVAVGDRVLVGQKIAEAGGFVSADIASSVSGTVQAVAPRTRASGDSVMAIVVENDGKGEAVPGYGVPRDENAMSKEEILRAVRDAGIVGMGGAGFPTHVKLSVKEGTKIDYILCNGAECEPYITCDERLMRERPALAVRGMRILLRLFPDAVGIFGVENNKKEGIEALRAAACGETRMRVEPLRKKYPQGGERMLIRALTGRKLNAKLLPADVGCVVINLSTLAAIAEAVCEGKPLTHRIVTVTGDAVKSPSNFDVPLGMSAAELIEAAGGFADDPEKVIFGGPMMGAAVYDLNVPITKINSCILAVLHDETDQYAPLECIRCGKCLTACPERLMPIKLKNAADAGDYEEFEKMHGLECIGCGCCTYVCPAKRRLSPSITTAKNHVLAEKKKGALKK